MIIVTIIISRQSYVSKGIGRQGGGYDNKLHLVDEIIGHISSRLYTYHDEGIGSPATTTTTTNNNNNHDSNNNKIMIAIIKMLITRRRLL